MSTESKALVLTLALALMSLPVHSGPFSSDRPEAPSGLKAVAVSSSAILLSWEPAHSPPSLPIVGYSIHYVPTQGGQKGNEIVVNTTSHLFDSLKPSTHYTFRVVAFNGKGYSEPSERVVQMTKEVDRPEAPSGLKAVAVSSSAILLSWEPAHSPPSPPIEAYAIHYVPTQGGQEEYATVDNTTTSHLIDGLEPSTHYTFQVIAYNSKRASEPSESVVQRTKEDAGLALSTPQFGLSLGFTDLSPPLVIAPKNHPVLLNCTGYSEIGPLQLSWRPKDKNLTILANGSLRIDRLAPQKRKRSYDGKYTCVLRNDMGTLLSYPIHVVLARMSENFTLEPESQNATGFGQALLSCEIDAVPPATTTWYRNGVKLLPNPRRYTILPSGSLQISAVNLHDNGSYKCQRSNIAGTKNSSEALLTAVLRPDKEFGPPVFLHHRHQETALAGTPAVLVCFADGFPKVEYSWRREDGKEMTEQHLLGNGNLFFPQVQKEHAGTYVCTAKVTRRYRGQIQQESNSIQASLIVHVPPIFTKVPTSRGVLSSTPVRFYCEVESHPASTIYWVKDGKKLNISGRIKLMPRDTLVVSDTVTTDSGIYQCVASNSAGVNTSAARLLVLESSDRPQAPTGLQAVAMSNTSILVSWEPAHAPPSLPIVAYGIQYAPTQGGLEIGVVVRNTTHLIDSLQPKTSYTFYVIAFNGKGQSDPSDSVVQVTQ